MYHNLFDSHTHTSNSTDAEHSLIYLAEVAEQNGFMGFAVTDHVECIGFEENGYRTRSLQSMVDTAKAKAAFRHRLSLSCGVELGVAHGFYAVAHEAAQIYPYDFILGSCHFTRDGKGFSRINYKSLSKDELHRMMIDYFDDQIELALWGEFDSLAHPTYPVRYALKCGGEGIDLSPYREQIDKLLRLLIEKGKAIELNSCGLRYPLDKVLPPRWLLERYKELGGELITIGSDAHQAGFLGRGIVEVMSLLADMGYRYFTFYRSRQPIMLRIV